MKNLLRYVPPAVLTTILLAGICVAEPPVFDCGPTDTSCFRMAHTCGNVAATITLHRKHREITGLTLDQVKRALLEAFRPAEVTMIMDAVAAPNDIAAFDAVNKRCHQRYLNALEGYVEERASPDEAQARFRDCSNCPEMVAIPGGRFTMGSSLEEHEYDDGRESPMHEVRVRTFALAKTHITRAQYAAFVEATGGPKSPNERGRMGCSWQNPGFPQEDDHPVVCVSWDAAQAYVQWLSRKTGKTYRLPSEAEWEYAARGGSTTARWWGPADRFEICRYANIADQTSRPKFPRSASSGFVPCSDGYAYTSPVERFGPNTFGLYDMIGNAWQWTEDCWNETYVRAPIDGSSWLRGNCAKRVVRGSAWEEIFHSARSANRIRSDHNGSGWTTGFRVARTLP